MPIILVKDSFTRDSSPDGLGYTETGHAWQTESDSDWRTIGDQAYLYNGNDRADIHGVNPVYVEISEHDEISFQMHLFEGARYVRMAWRIVSEANYFFLHNGRVYVRENLQETPVGSITYKDGDTIRITMFGEVHTIYVNGVQQLQFTSSKHLRGKKFGFNAGVLTGYTLGSAVRVDDFLIEFHGVPDPAPPPKTDDIECFIVSETGEILELIDEYENLEWNRPYIGSGSFKLEITHGQFKPETMQKGMIFCPPESHQDETVPAFRIEQVEFDIVDTDLVIISGRSVGGFADDRLALPPEHTPYDRKSGPAETVMKHYVERHMGPAAAPKRRMAGLTVAPDLGRGAHVEYEARFQSIAKVLEDVGTLTDMGWEIRFNLRTGQFVFDVIEGEDHTADAAAPVVFDIELESAMGANWVSTDLDRKTYTYVGGQGEGMDRVIVERFIGGTPFTGTPARIIERDGATTATAPFESGTHEGTAVDQPITVGSDGLLISPTPTYRIQHPSLALSAEAASYMEKGLTLGEGELRGTVYNGKYLELAPSDQTRSVRMRKFQGFESTLYSEPFFNITQAYGEIMMNESHTKDLPLGSGSHLWFLNPWYALSAHITFNFTIAADHKNPVFTFRWKTSFTDGIRVTVTPQGQQGSTQTLSYSKPADTTWMDHTINLNTYVGKTISISITTAKLDAKLDDYVFIDNVEYYSEPTVTEYMTEGYRISPPIPLPNRIADFQMSRIGTLATGSDIRLEAAISAGPQERPSEADFMSAADFNAWIQEASSIELEGKYLWSKQILATTDISKTPRLTETTVKWGKVFPKTGVRTSPPVDLSGVRTAGNSLIEWTAYVPDGTNLVIEASIDGGYSWFACENNAPIPAIVPGDVLTGRTLLLRQSFTTVDQWVTPELTRLKYEVLPGTHEEPKGYLRREMFVDARDVESSVALSSRGDVKMQETAEENLFETLINPNGPFRYLRDWNLGDMVTIRNRKWGIQQHVRIVQVKCLSDSQDSLVSVELGRRFPTQKTNILREIDRGTNQRL